MHYWIPRLVLGVLQPQPLLPGGDKFGGLPWGLPQVLWPRDATGAYPFFAQVSHHPTRANLGKDNRVAYMFLGGAETYGTVVFADQGQQLSGPTPLPNPKTVILTEAWVAEWNEGDDGLSDSILAQFMSDDKYFSDEIQHQRETILTSEDVPAGTKLGSVPDWVQSPYDAPPVPPFSFIGQFSGDFDFDGPAPSAEQTGCPIELPESSFWSTWFPKTIKPHRRIPHPGAPRKIRVFEDGSYSCDDNYIGDGLAYLFVKPDLVNPVGKFFIQVT